ncbi:MAG: DNA-deoxyinosine glycosylase [Methylomonas sp.]|jgi:hypoxanthine-DNA glycosylase|uniref:DNA-deoxyinosine glycosylase n=1 Tax=Methylomonas sp. TaxID=418 RepID=UPI0025EC3D27|nr:DNA-deoxyinosine glycosylase [Methylomonas sp.]MCK9607085.1 DNA-deoxyinosine glycosylase [Methylomonas sp.]
MSDIQSFPPIAGPNARILILGSIPGKASLDAGEYYAHPRNQFWPIIAELLQCGPLPDYASKTQALLDANIAVWDVMQSCFRPGSLDAAIEKRSIIVNDFQGFLADHPRIRYIFFNGATAEQAFKRLVLPGLTKPDICLQRLPSTSPAHAAWSLQQKLQSWSVITSGSNSVYI